MILIDTVEDLYDFFDNLPDVISCYDVTENKTTRLEVINDDYTYIDKWFTDHKDYKVKDFHIGRESTFVTVHLEIENDEE